MSFFSYNLVHFLSKSIHCLFEVLYYYDWVFSYVSQRKKVLCQNVFLLIFQISFVIFFGEDFQINEHLVVIVQYCADG